MAWKTQNEHKARPFECPACYSPNISGDTPEVDGCEIFQCVACNDCGAAWEDIYTLYEYEPIQDGC